MGEVRFRATVGLHGKTATGIEVPPDAIERLAGGRKPAVKVTIGDGTYRTTVAARGERFLIPLSAENRAVTGVSAGDAVDVVVAMDLEPRTVEVPQDLGEALAAEPAAGEFFAGLTFSQRKEYVRWVESAKKEETRRARIEKSTALLLEGKKSH